ncbi:MAG: hypothetical protein U9Q38_06775, partial [Thermodesulfobacteriota bacterium]|nr:hypothetical protein [Thermodesulfobacteriota bacterium]
KSQRVSLMCNLKKDFKNKYAPYYLKKERIGLDIEEHMDSCIKKEIEIDQNSNLKFYERIRKCLAAVKDTHLYAKLQMPYSTVLLGMSLVKIEDKYYIKKN